MTLRPPSGRVGRRGAILAWGSLALAWGCVADGDSIPDAPALRPVEALGVAGVETRLFSIEGLEGPEAVKYDAAQDVYFISNFGPSDDPDANDGYLSRVAAEDGAVEKLRWAVGDADRPLREPRGMALAGDTLWVADVGGLHAFDPVTGIPRAGQTPTGEVPTAGDVYATALHLSGVDPTGKGRNTRPAMTFVKKP